MESTPQSNNNLLSPDAQWSDSIQMGDLLLENRIVMASLTRCRCNPDNNIPTAINADYYAQRAGAGFIITQATPVSQQGEGYLGSACLYNQKHVLGWKQVIDAVHDKGGAIFVQLVHCGRRTHPSLNKGLYPIGPSALTKAYIMPGLNIEFPIPKEMTSEDIKKAKNEFKQSMKMAKEAGFDGIEINGAFGYLLDSFMKTSCNQRTDHYGGSIQNRCRLTLEVIELAIDIFGKGRVGIKVSPYDEPDQNPLQLIVYLTSQLDKRGIAFIEIKEERANQSLKSLLDTNNSKSNSNISSVLRKHFRGTIIANCKFAAETGIALIRRGDADMVSFGRLYIGNPDLAERIINNKQIYEKMDFNTFYGYELGQKGYTDYSRSI